MDTENDAAMMSAKAALDQYLNLPAIGLEEDTFEFWQNYSRTTNKAQQCLCDLACHYLTPPPTSTSKCIIQLRY